MLNKMTLMGSVAVIAMVVVSPAIAAPVNADESPKAEVSSDNGADIIVTARKIDEKAQDVPLAINAFSAKDLQEKSLTSLQDIALQTPGLVYEDYSNGGYGTPTIRGATQFSITSLEQNVSVFLDGIYVPRQYSFDVGTLSLERVEVVKGPQSALYGANAFAGAINYITTNRSLTKLGGRAQVGVSENGGFDIGGRINVPVIAGRLSLRAAGSKSDFGGDIKNSHPNANVGIYPGTNGNYAGYKNDSYMFGATVKPADILSINFDYYHFDVNNEVHAGYRIESSNRDTNCGRAGGLYCGVIPVTPVNPPSGLPIYVQDPRSSGIAASTNVYRGSADLELSDTLSLSYLFGKIDGQVFAAGDSEKNPLVGNAGASNTFTFGPEGNYSYMSHEARLQYAAQNGIYAMIGGFVQDGTDLDIFSFGFQPFRGTTPITSSAGSLVSTPSTTRTNTRAVFGRVGIPLLDDRLNISAEGRYTDVKKNLVSGALNFNYNEKYFTPRFSVDFKITPANLIYASVARGVKSGGVNPSTFAALIAAERYYGPDANWTYEIGSKNSFANGKGFVNVAAFYIDWSNLQVPQTPTGAPINTATVVVNIGGAKSRGVEVAAEYEVLKNFRLNAGFAYINATFNSGTISGRLARAGICDNVVCASNGNVSGNTLQRYSPWQWNIGAAYEAPITSSIKAFGRLDVFGESRQFTDESNTAIIGARTLANLRVGVRGNHWEVSAWAKNLFDKVYATNAFFTATPFGTSYVPSIGNRRRVGGTLSINF
ncbi:TonB-dependent receptor [Sphingomonas sp. 28-63-12]|uniref:TonB-dependent receptor n=1 Tax=Sphingomonas sp. 28-63-12 TaxID=1970434 RepID=UPI000BC7B911|nr:MAG: hypothetical protein B7Y47_02195 [Sphingomonas sp. 28-63-12]